MAHKMGQGSTQNGRDSNPQHRGVKAYGGERVKPGSIIVRQCGTKFHPGLNVGMGKDYTIFSKTEGTVEFRYTSGGRQVIEVNPVEQNQARAAE